MFPVITSHYATSYNDKPDEILDERIREKRNIRAVEGSVDASERDA